ncbi:MAG: hypothetical protein HZA49_09940 [Planctomycetes bacterium]|nr:hypothetical protein [Planctomycetota bacterium]
MADIKPPVAQQETRACQGCNNTLPKEETIRVNGLMLCRNCNTSFKEKLTAQQPDGSDYLTGFLGACAAAIVAGIIWGLMVILTNYEIGYAAIGVGVLAGYGVYFASGKKGGPVLQILASASSIIGVLIGKYITFYHFFRKGATEAAKEQGIDPTKLTELLNQFTLFSGNMISSFIENIGSVLGGFDILWVILAVSAAYKIPKIVNPYLLPGKAENE